MCVHTHSLSVYGVHREEEGGEEGQAGVVEHATITRVHEQTGHGTVKTHVDHMEVDWGHSTQEDVQSDGERDCSHHFTIIIREKKDLFKLKLQDMKQSLLMYHSHTVRNCDPPLQFPPSPMTTVQSRLGSIPFDLSQLNSGRVSNLR